MYKAVATVDGVTVTGSLGAAIAVSDGAEVTISNTTTDGAWGDIGIMYDEGRAVSNVTIGEGNNFQSELTLQGTALTGWIYSDRPDTDKVDTLSGLENLSGWNKVALPAGWAYTKTEAKVTNTTTGVGYATLAEAVAASSPENVIELAAGEHVVDKMIIVPHSLSIVGQGKDKTTIKGPDKTGAPDGAALTFQYKDGTASSLSKLTVDGRNGGGTVYWDIADDYITNDSPTTIPTFTVNDCKFTDTRGGTGAGIGMWGKTVEHRANVSASKVTIKDCVFDGIGVGIYNEEEGSLQNLEAIIQNNTFTNSNWGILGLPANAQITGNTFDESCKNAIQYLFNEGQTSTKTKIEGNTINSPKGIEFMPYHLDEQNYPSGNKTVNVTKAMVPAIKKNLRTTDQNLLTVVAYRSGTKEIAYFEDKAIDLSENYTVGKAPMVNTVVQDGGPEVGTVTPTVVQYPYYLDKEMTQLSKLPVTNETQKKSYATIADAVAAAKTGDVIRVAAGKFEENVKVTKDVKLYGANAGNNANSSAWNKGAETVVTGGFNLYGPFDGSTVLEIKGFTFQKNGIYSVGWGNGPKLDGILIENNRFENIHYDVTTPGIAGTSVVDYFSPIHFNMSSHIASDPANNVTIRNNYFSATYAVQNAPGNAASGIYGNFRGRTVVSGNVFDGTAHNGVTLITVGALEITGNTFKNWNYDGLGGGRAARLDFVQGSTGNLVFTGNKMISKTEPKESFMKITGFKPGAANLTRNYWAGNDPATTKAGDGKPLAEFYAGWDPKTDPLVPAEDSIYPYYSDVDLTTLVYRDSKTEEAIEAAITKVTEALKTDNTLKDKTLVEWASATLTSEQTTALQNQKNAFKAALDMLNGIAPAELQAVLDRNATLKAQVEAIRTLSEIAFTVKEQPVKPQTAVQEVTPPTVSDPELKQEVVEKLNQEVKQQTEALKTTIETETTSNTAAQKAPEGIKEAVALETLKVPEDTKEIHLTVVPTLKEIKAEASVNKSSDGEPTAEVAPVELVFEVLPYATFVPTTPTNPEATVPLKNDQIRGNITFRLPIPSSVTTKYVHIVHVFSDLSGSEEFDLEIQGEGSNRYVEVTVKKFSKFTLTFTNTLPSSGGSKGSSGGGSRPSSQKIQAENDFWRDVADRIRRADDGDVVKANASNATNVPITVLRALEGKDVTLVISHKGHETILNGLEMKELPKNKVFYTFDDLEELYADRTVDESGNTLVGEKYIPVTGGYTPGVTQATVTVEAPQALGASPKEELAAAPKAAAGRAVPAAEPKAAAAQPEAGARRSIPVLPFVLLALAVAAGAAAFLLYRRRGRA